MMGEPALLPIPCIRIPCTESSVRHFEIWSHNACLICDLQGVGRKDGEPVLGWRLGETVFVDASDCAIAMHFREQAGGAPLAAVFKGNSHGRRAYLIDGRTLRRLTRSSFHIFNASKGRLVGPVPQSVLLLNASMLGIDPACDHPYRRIEHDSAAGRMLEQFLVSLRSELVDLSVPDADVLAAGLGRLVGGLTRQKRPVPEPAPRRNRRRRIEVFIADNLDKAGFGAANVRDAFGAARSTLYRDFADFGGIERYIRNKRLEQAFIDLAQSEQAQGMVSRIAERWCFSSLSHFSRLFQAEFGYWPSDIQGTVIEGADTYHHARPIPDDLRTLAAWLSEISRG